MFTTKIPHAASGFAYREPLIDPVFTCLVALALAALVVGGVVVLAVVS